jgi:nucleotide-binding universal stress UspA family protein
MKRILHPSDFSSASRPAFRKALEMAKAARGRLLIVHVLAAPLVVPETYLSPSTYDDLERSIRAVAQRDMNRLLAQAKRARVPASGRLLEGVPVHDRIVRSAKAARADVIVMGTHGRSGISRVFLGSVAARVLATASCPVLTVRGR